MKNDLTAEQLQQLVTVTLPLGVVLRITANGEKPLSASGNLMNQLPAIGAGWASFDHAKGVQSGIYAGLSLENERPIALVLLPGELSDLDWDHAMRWAQEQDASLPSRIDQLVLFKNLKSEFKEAAYWSDTPNAGDVSWAWYQYFFTGGQYRDRKGSQLRARAVRRIAI